MNNKRDAYIDVVKGITIISIVIGHASWDLKFPFGVTIEIGKFVYLYHISTFLFCSGYLYNNEKNDLWSYVSRRFQSIYMPYLVYIWFYYLFRNILIHLGVIEGQPYGIINSILYFSNAVCLVGGGELLSAFWFIPMMFFNISIFAVIICLSSKIDNRIFKILMRVITICAIGLVGIISVENGLGILYNLQISYLLLPVTALGFCARKIDIKKYCNTIGIVISVAIMIYIIEKDYGYIELSRNMIINRRLFYPVTCISIFFVLCLAKQIMKIEMLKNGLSIVGRYSYDIMAMHFLAIKLVDIIVCHMIGRHDLLSNFPHSFENIWLVYYIVGVVLPIIIRILFNKVLSWIKKQSCFIWKGSA